MQPPIPSDHIRLRQRKTLASTSAPGEESGVTLSEKLREFFAAGYERDEIYGVVIPLLMQGKVRVDLEGRSERLELEDPGQILQRSGAIQAFEDFVLVYGAQPAVPVAQAV